MRGEQAIGLRRAQMEVFRCAKRFRVVVAGRRFGKTHLALVELLRAACHGKKTAWYVAPSERQAKRMAWERLKELTGPFQAGRPNESDLSVRLRSGGVIALRGADRPESLRGHGLDFVVLDEYGSMKPECWTEVLRPALADREGRALFVGTPQGANHFLERFEHAQNDAEWSAFQFTTAEGGNVAVEELESAARELDERVYRQEFEARFESVGQGQAYYAFSRTENVAACAYRPGEPLIWALDFNVNPMCSVLAQKVGHVVQVLEELVLPDAHTGMACEELLRRTAEWRRRWGTVFVTLYGDASGYQRRTCGTETDWGVIRDFFAGWRGQLEPTVLAGRSNPGVRDRVALVNGRLCNAAGERGLVVDPRCRELIRDFERVRWQVDGAGRAGSELDKSDRRRTHVSDALGYYVSQEFRLVGSVGERGRRLV